MTIQETINELQQLLDEGRDPETPLFTVLGSSGESFELGHLFYREAVKDTVCGDLVDHFGPYVEVCC